MSTARFSTSLRCRLLYRRTYPLPAPGNSQIPHALKSLENVIMVNDTNLFDIRTSSVYSWGSFISYVNEKKNSFDNLQHYFGTSDHIHHMIDIVLIICVFQNRGGSRIKQQNKAQ